VLEQRIKVISETLARAVDRRTFLRQTGTAVVSGVTALALGSLLSTSPARAAVRGVAPAPPQCSPPGPYCNLNGVNDPNGCHGGHCYRHLSGGIVRTCQVYYQYYQAGCWTTASGGGYWTCCDCQCSGGSTCGCAQFTLTPAPLAE
jgi:hypothetical protein